MYWNNKKKMSVAAALFIVSSSLVIADVNNAQMRNLENRVTVLEQRRSGSGVINPQGRPQIRNGADLFVYGDLLYWKATENGLPLGILNKNSSNNLSHAQVKNLTGKWDAGFRVGLGYNLPHDGWDLSLSWLRYNSPGQSKRIHSSSNRFIFPTLAPSTDPIAQLDSAQKARGRWKLLLNQLDLDLGREFFVSKWMTLRPHAGLRTTWVHQRAKAEYENFGLLPPPSEVDVKYRDKWWGIGLESGLDTQWGLGGGWSIFANLALAVIYGEHHLKVKDKNDPSLTGLNNGASANPSGVFVRLSDKYWIAHPILDLQMGLRWDWMYCNDHLHVGVQIGWENHVYFSQNQLPQLCDTFNLGKFFANQGDLSLEGWTLGLRLDF